MKEHRQAEKLGGCPGWSLTWGVSETFTTPWETCFP